MSLPVSQDQNQDQSVDTGSLWQSAISRLNNDSTTEDTSETLPSADDISVDASGGEDTEGSDHSLSQEDSTSELGTTDSQKGTSNVDYVSVTDHTGRKVKLKVDYSDKDSIKRAYSMAAGARKWQAERDQVRKEFDSFKETAGSKVENWDAISDVYQEQGIKGLVNFLEGSENAFDSIVQDHLREKEFFDNASPSELETYHLKQTQSKKDKELETLRKEMESIRQSQLSQAEKTEMAQVSAEVYPAFDKYRFAGKLGNQSHEHMLDEMLWNNAMKQLSSLPDDAPLSQAQISKVFRDYSQSMRTLVNKQADKKASQALENKKRASTEKAQLQAVKQTGQATSNTVGDYLSNGDILGLFKAAGARNKNFIR